MSCRDRFGPVDYKGFIDGEGFDGGDGQVGCVGDGERDVFSESFISPLLDLKGKRCRKCVYDDDRIGHTNRPGLLGWGAYQKCNLGDATSAHSLLILVLLRDCPRRFVTSHFSFFWQL